MLSLFPHKSDALQFTPLPENASNAARDSILNRGFVKEAFLELYRYTSQAGSFTLNALAFSDPRRRTPDEFAGITLYNAAGNTPDDQIVKTLAQTAAPFHLIHRDDSFSFWASTIKDSVIEPVRIETNIVYDQLDPVLATYAADLSPTRIVDVKQGRAQFAHSSLRPIKPRQLALWAFDVTRDLLVRHFGDAVALLRSDTFFRDLDAKQREDTIVDLAIQLLGAVILADTGVLGDAIRRREHELTFDHLIRAAYSQHPNYFKPDLFMHYADPASQAYGELRQIRYAGFVPDMLSYLYTTAYDREQRKKLGRFDTPLYLTRRIWDTIPAEFLKPEQRITVDMTCGWGSFLIAGYDRLSQIRDMRGYRLRDYLYGNDSDRFTARLAGLGLLLSTSEDSWHVDDQDALTWNWLNANQPGIIVGNPPFGGRRDQPETLDVLMPEKGRKRVEAANRFVHRTIQRLAPNGYLALVLPRSFLVSEAAPTIRRELLETCDVTDIWQLPQKIFRDATVQPIVLFAQKHKHGHRVSFPVRIRNVQNNTLEAFKTDGIFTASGIVSNQANWNERARMAPDSTNTHLITPYLILSEAQWSIIRATCDTLASVAVIFPGTIKGRKKQNKRWLDIQNNERILWLTNTKRIVQRPWYINYGQAIALEYPKDFEEPRLDHKDMLSQNKVLLIAKPNPSWGRRSRAVIERKGYYVSHSFWVVVPLALDKSLITYEVIACVLNWYISNAWVAENLSYTWIERRIVDTIPFPRYLSQADCAALTAAVHELEQAAANNLPLPNDAQDAIDTILKAAYRLDEATFERLRVIAEWDRRPQTTLDPQPDRSLADYQISGVVDQVDADQGTITLWISGFDHLQTVPIDSLMPGWMLRPEAAFRARIPYSCERTRDLETVVWDHITPQQYTYLNEDELVANLTDVFFPDGTSQA